MKTYRVQGKENDSAVIKIGTPWVGQGRVSSGKQAGSQADTQAAGRHEGREAGKKAGR